MNDRDRFLRYLCPTSGDPVGLEVASAEGSWIVDVAGKRYLDWMAGVSVGNVGHRHPAVVQAVHEQLDRFLHVMVYGEYVQHTQVRLAQLLCELAPFPDAQVYFTSSGAEAVEGALKVARKYTGRAGFVAFEYGYHGDTLGALSVLGRSELRKPFEPLLQTEFLPFGDEEALSRIDERAAAVIVEPLQAEGGVRVPPDSFLPALRRRCDQMGTLLIADEVQTGLGRTGRRWGNDHWGVIPDLLVLAKALGGGLPLGAFVGRRSLMSTLAVDPPLAHLTTFGGHPLSCAAGFAALRLMQEEDLARQARETGAVIVKALAGLKERGAVVDVRGRGLLLGVELTTNDHARAVIAQCHQAGLLVGSALHDERVLRLTPALNMTDDEAARGVDLLTSVLVATAPGRKISGR